MAANRQASDASLVDRLYLNTGTGRFVRAAPTALPIFLNATEYTIGRYLSTRTPKDSWHDASTN